MKKGGNMNEFKHDWGSLIVDIVKKKDLDTYEWADCWDEDYDWTEFDLFVIENYFEEMLDWATYRFAKSRDDCRKDLEKYKNHLLERDNNGI